MRFWIAAFRRSRGTGRTGCALGLLLAAFFGASPTSAATYIKDVHSRVAVGPNGDALVRFGLQRLFGPNWSPYPAAAWSRRGAPFEAPFSVGKRINLDYAVDSSGTATGTVSLLAEPWFGSVVAVTGGDFGDPQPPHARNATAGSRLALGDRGEAAIAWVETNDVRAAIRPAGGMFGEVIELGNGTSVGGVTIGPDSTAHVLVTERLTQGADYERAVLYTIRPDRSVEKRELERGVAGAALVRGSGGDILAVNQPSYLSSDRISVVQVWADGRQSVPVLIGDGSLVGALLQPDGAATVVWTLQGIVVSQGNVTDGFTATRLALGKNVQPVPIAGFAANKRGDAAITWGYEGYRPQAAYRSAGGQFGLPMTLSEDPVARSLPSVGIDEAGVATLTWVTTDLRTDRVLVRRLGPSGLDPQQQLAEAPALPVQPRSLKRCRAMRRRAVVRNRYAVVYRDDPASSRVRVCSLETGRTRVLRGRGEFPDFTDTVRLAGRLVAYGSIGPEGDLEEPHGSADVPVFDVRAGYSPRNLSISNLGSYLVGDVVLTDDGAVAATVCRKRGGVTNLRDPSKAVRQRCSKPGPEVAIVVADGPFSSHAFVAGSRRIDPASLKLNGRRYTWREGNRTRSGTLARRALP